MDGKVCAIIPDSSRLILSAVTEMDVVDGIGINVVVRYFKSSALKTVAHVCT